MPRHFDTAIIGAGQAGPALAMYLADGGESVAMIEGNLLGGSCVNYGCTPTKTLRKSARVAYLARRAADFGVVVADVTVDFAVAMARMRDRVQTSRAGLESGLESAENIEILRGWGAFSGHDNGRFTVQVGDQTVTADKVFINTGTRASIPPIKGIETVPYLDNVSLLELTECPAHLIVVGGSYIGLEMGQIFRRLGAQVTLLNSSARLASREDEDVPELATSLIAAFRKQSEIAIGNIVGSNIFNVLGILGVTALIAPIPIADRFLSYDLPVMIAASLALTALLLLRPKISRVTGVILLVAYAAYVWAAQG